MKITFLIDNESESSRFLKEHGFSCWIEAEVGHEETIKILFDAGRTDKFLTNAARLGIDVKSNHYTLISHGHNDHGGGLTPLLKEAPHTQVTLSKRAFEVYLKGDAGEKVFYAEKSLGLNEALLKSHRSSFNLIDKTTQLEKGITVHTELEMKYPTPINNRLCKMGKRKKMERDDFSHEIYLAIEEGDKLICFTGCSHRGAVNIMSMIEKEYPGKTSYTMVGGLHLKDETDSSQIEILNSFIRSSVNNWSLVTGHCTGVDKYDQLKKALTCSVEYGFSGKTVTL